MYFRIDKDGHGMGDFLCPPGHPNHDYVVLGWASKGMATRWGPERATVVGALDTLADGRDYDASLALCSEARRILDEATLVYSELWIKYVYAYFRNSYSPDGIDRNASHAVYWRKGDDAPKPPADHHSGYLCVLSYFPEHEPRLDLIENPGNGFGWHHCVKCLQRIGYEARYDALCAVDAGQPRLGTPEEINCPAGGLHES